VTQCWSWTSKPSQVAGHARFDSMAVESSTVSESTRSRRARYSGTRYGGMKFVSRTTFAGSFRNLNSVFGNAYLWSGRVKDASQPEFLAPGERQTPLGVATSNLVRALPPPRV
jgi:hypothetical protein